MNEVNDIYSFPGGVCPDCEHSPLMVKLQANEQRTWMNVSWYCPHCGNSSFLSKSNESASHDSALTNWAKQVKARDENRCVLCGETRDLDAHHLISKSQEPRLQYKLDNGITLCRRCHRMVHDGTARWPEKYR